MKSRHLDSPEMLSEAPPGTVITTADGVLAWRKCSASKTDWEKLRPAPGGWEPLEPPERGSRVFASIVARRRREHLRVVE